jgi:hypothetical protein
VPQVRIQDGSLSLFAVSGVRFSFIARLHELDRPRPLRCEDVAGGVTALPSSLINIEYAIGTIAGSGIVEGLQNGAHMIAVDICTALWMWLSEHKIRSVQKPIDESRGGHEALDADFICQERCIRARCKRRVTPLPDRMWVVRLTPATVFSAASGSARFPGWPWTRHPIRSARIKGFAPPIGQN